MTGSDRASRAERKNSELDRDFDTCLAKNWESGDEEFLAVRADGQQYIGPLHTPSTLQEWRHVAPDRPRKKKLCPPPAKPPRRPRVRNKARVKKKPTVAPVPPPPPPPPKRRPAPDKRDVADWPSPSEIEEIREFERHHTLPVMAAASPRQNVYGCWCRFQLMGGLSPEVVAELMPFVLSMTTAGEWIGAFKKRKSLPVLANDVGHPPSSAA